MEDKPFQCPKCDQCFANSDRLAVHQLMHLKQPAKLQVKIPMSENDNGVADQTPTPSSFLKTADVEGSPLFQELNPFDRDFKLASNGRQTSTVEVNASTILTTPVVHTMSVSRVKKEREDKDAVVQHGYCEEVIQESINTESITVTAGTSEAADNCVSSTTSTGATSKMSNQSTSEVFQSLLSQIKTQEEDSTKEDAEQKQVLNGNQDALREQLKSLLNSGLIKIQITPFPSSTKVQATIVGNVATTSKPETTTRVETTSHVETSMITPGVQRIAPKIPQNSVQITKLPPGVTPTFPHMPPNTNLQFAKQKLKQVIQGTEQEHPTLQNITMTTPASTSSQGKYKDIILQDDIGDSDIGKRRGRTSSEDYTPEEKRRRFLERNRAAASRCRQKRKIWVNQLEQKSDGLVSTNAHLLTEITALRNEVTQLKALLLAHKDCPVTLQQKELVNQITSGLSPYVTVSDGQLITLQQLASAGIREASDEEVASSALTDMAARATIELTKKATSGVVTVQANDGSPTKISTLLQQ